MHPCLHIDRVHLVNVLLTLILSFIFFDHLFAQEPVKAANVFRGNESAYQLSIEDHRITLKAEDASLKCILEAIGQKMAIEVVARIPEEKKITIRFEDQALEEALKLMKANYALVTDSEEKSGVIKRIVVVPKEQQAQLAMSASGDSDQQTKIELKQENRSNPEPYKFVFDPSKVIDKQE